MFSLLWVLVACPILSMRIGLESIGWSTGSLLQGIIQVLLLPGILSVLYMEVLLFIRGELFKVNGGSTRKGFDAELDLTCAALIPVSTSSQDP